MKEKAVSRIHFVVLTVVVILIDGDKKKSFTIPADIACSKSTFETIEKEVKYVWS